MKQVLQNLGSGQLEVAEVPAPTVRAGHLLIRTRYSLISSGTERMLIEFARSNLLSKARQQPEKVRQVLSKLKAEGFLATLNAVRQRLDDPLPLGYSNCGEVVSVGSGVPGFGPGDRVVSNGPHAEFVSVPQNLAARIPDGVSDAQAVFTVPGAIALQGIRLIQPSLGETVVVTGLGLVGLLAVQLLRASGCRVIGIDHAADRLALARGYGAETITPGEDPVESVRGLTQGRGADAVLIAASAKQDTIIHQSAQMCRPRGRIVLVGVVNLDLDRADFYTKEISFQVSCSYGPGRYDPSYEERGIDYPLGHVRWTVQRNFEAVLHAAASGRLATAEMINARIPIAQAQEAYTALTEDPGKLGLVLTYPADAPQTHFVATAAAPSVAAAEQPVTIGVIGAGNFTKMTLLPNLKGSGARLKAVADLDGARSYHASRKHGFAAATSDEADVLADPEINLVIIATRHDSHARLVCAALAAGKHVAVEKPLCLTPEELTEIASAHAQADRLLMVGFNRRFSPHTVKIKQLVSTRTGPLCMSILVNAGQIPADAWTQDRAIGGGRLIGEGCHWLDLMAHLAEAKITSVVTTTVGAAGSDRGRDDKTSITIALDDGSIGTLHYFANGHRSYPKERLDIFCDGKNLHLVNFRKLSGYGWPGFGGQRTMRPEKGHREQFQQIVQCVGDGGAPLIPFDAIENATLATFAAVASAEGGQRVAVPLTARP